MTSLDETLIWMDQLHRELVLSVPLPEKIKVREKYSYHYTEQTLAQAVVQKLARIPSGLRAAKALLDLGLLQEQAAICRMVDEFQEDVVFLSFGIIDGSISPRHRQYLESFFSKIENEQLDPSQFFEKKNLVSRRKISAYIANHRLTPGDPSGAISSNTKISTAYSGYVHGFSVNIMEMYSPSPPMFLTAGMSGSRLQVGHRHDFFNFIYRGVMAFCFATHAIGEASLQAKAMQFLESFEKSHLP